MSAKEGTEAVPQTEEEPVEPYEPYDHREETGRKLVGDFASWGTLLRSAIGTGIFAFPNAFACVGVALGIVGTVLMGTLICTSLQFLVRLHYKICVLKRQPIMPYGSVVISVSDFMKKSEKWSNGIALFMDVMIIICYVGIGSIYVVFISGIVQELADPNESIPQGCYALILFPLFLGMNMLKELGSFAPISTVGNVLLLIAVTIGIVYALKDGVGDDYVMLQKKDAARYPKFLGTVFFSLASPPLILEIENSMRKPLNYKKFCGVLNWGMASIVVVHVIVGTVGYMKWGEKAQGNFILNQPEYEPATVTALIMQAMAIYLSYGLTCYMPIKVLYNDYTLPALKNKNLCGSPLCWDLTIRIGLTLLTCILAASIPKLDLFISLVGAFCMATLGVLIPILLDIITHYGNFGRWKWRLILGIFIFVIGFVAMICAGATSIKLLIYFFKYDYY